MHLTPLVIQVGVLWLLMQEVKIVRLLIRVVLWLDVWMLKAKSMIMMAEVDLFITAAVMRQIVKVLSLEIVLRLAYYRNLG